MTDKRHWFQKNSPLTDHCWSVTDQCWNLKVANDFTLWVRGVGDVVVTATVNGTLSTIPVKDVLYVLKLRKNLVSQASLRRMVLQSFMYEHYAK